MKIIEKPSLPKGIFSVDAKPQLLAQAVRVYLANQRQGNQNAKTRAEVNRTRHKLYKQKGTGGARHGDRKAPIFVGGGVTFAPKPRDYSLSMSGTLKKRALFGALTAMDKAKKLSVFSGGDKLTGKTAELAKFITTTDDKAKKFLLVTDVLRANVYRAARNIPGVTVTPVNQLNTYEVLRTDRVLVMEEALDNFGKQPLRVEKVEVKKVAVVKTAKKAVKKTTVKAKKK